MGKPTWRHSRPNAGSAPLHCFMRMASPTPLPSAHSPLPRSVATVTPAFHLLHVFSADSPLEQCLVVDYWLLAMFGIVLPLTALAALERQARRLFAQHQQRQQQRAGAAASAEARPAGPAAQRARRLAKLGRPHIGWRLFLTSSTAWAVSCIAGMLSSRSSP